jgi:hypothetical protein
VIKRNHLPSTPYERALAHPKVTAAVKKRLRDQYRSLDPVALLAEISRNPKRMANLCYVDNAGRILIDGYHVGWVRKEATSDQMEALIRMVTTYPQPINVLNRADMVAVTERHREDNGLDT